MPAVDQTLNIIINGARAAWMLRLDNAEATNLHDSILYYFDNVKSPKFGIKRPESASTAEEFIEVTTADGLIIQFPKTTIKLDGVTGAQKSGTSAVAGSGGTCSFTTNSAPVLSYTPYPLDADSVPTYMTWAAWMAELNDNLGADWLVIIPLGFTHAGWAARHSTGKVAGYAIMCGKLSADIELPTDGFTPTTIPLSFEARSVTGGVAAQLATAAIKSIRCYEGDDLLQYYTCAIPTSPDPLSAGSAADLLAGKVVIIEA